MSFIEGKTTGKWEYVIGLEIHAQIKSSSKLFSSASTEFGNLPNSQVELLDAAMPGALPVLNKFCVLQAIKTALGINAKINKLSSFDRKNYFYADLPAGYQISQFFHPIAQGGWVEIFDENNNIKRIKINRLHLEQDTGKSTHDQSDTYSYIDLNRSGIGLMEIVSEHDISSPAQAAEYIKKLRAILRYLDSCSGDMEKGSLRCDANISVRKPNGELGIKCEIKNLNSIKSIVRALEFEGQRQVKILESGGVIKQESLLFDATLGKTCPMRSKENATDYRYFPDPDLPPIILDQSLVDEIASSLPELPDAKITRYINEIKLNDYAARVLAADKDIAYFFEEVIKTANPILTANWILSELFGLMNKDRITISECKITAHHFSELMQLISSESISSKIAKTILKEMFDTGHSPKIIIQKKNIQQISDYNQIADIIDNILKDNYQSVISYKSGKDRLFGFFVGQVMKATAGNANPILVNKILHNKLNNQ
ncbi:aspartyl/glutamyl-tRNA(Asn/Gln) amidotransferase, B subunit [Orientia chuto str. Dubai]|uniref:Aspartyl/glutamyl-tRNA(Asn/Gln) amidotransferase subunit B n=1 Tax=Orientia chuto str. Dubai TaxID=1359168 RepID=A0A0F3MP58_9RICK|nr:Asp-tRNA(Asn)/Glu-tRNA(Gln) amidotransferase subunit GatB [Candidatus Orientia mediorientalis]KJV57232.1 aspartyl/glutamyl-tRNA(Asn/Gln) amidotransferase, B subunit [Orientia chuto str. Dubai]